MKSRYHPPAALRRVRARVAHRWLWLRRRGPVRAAQARLTLRTHLRAALTTVTGLVALVAIYPHAVGPWLWPEYEYMWERFQGTEVYDASGAYVGIVPGEMDPLGDFSTTGAVSPDHKSVYLEEVPEDWWRVLVAIEDRHLGTWRWVHGIDWVALGLAPLSALTPGRLRGGSTLPMLLVRCLWHRRAEVGEPIARKLWRKLFELRDAPVLALRLMQEGDGELQRWAAMHFPLVAGTPGSRMGTALYGLGAASQTLFGREPGELVLAEQAMLAAAVFRPILIGPEGDPVARAQRERRWARLKRRAAHGLDLAFPHDSLRRAAALADLEQLPLPRARIAAHLEPLVPADPDARFQVAANPFRRAHFFAGPELVQAIGELQDRYGRNWRRRVRAIHLTVDAAANKAFKRAAERRMQEVTGSWGRRLWLPLEGSALQAAVAVSDAEGRLVRFWAVGSDAFYGGSRAKRDADGRYVPAREDRPVGSLGKIPVVTLLGSLGDHVETRYCNRAIHDRSVRNAGGDTGEATCAVQGAWFSARETVARSLNLPLLWRLRSVAGRDLERLADDFGLTLPDDSPPSPALVLGLAAASPRTLHESFRRLLAELDAQGGGGSRGGPRIVRRVDEIPSEAPRPPTGPHSDGITRYLASPEARRFVAETLSGVVSRDGTLWRLADWGARRHPRVSLHIAKTGTSTLHSGAVRDLYVGGGLVLDGQHYAYLALLGTGTPAQPLGARLHGGNLAPLVRVALESLEGRGAL